MFNSFRNNLSWFSFFCLKDNLKFLYLKELKLHIMRKTLLILLLFAFGVSNGQTLPFEIIGFTGNLGNPSSGQIDGEQQRNYERFGAVNSFNQASSGPNQSWDISGLTGLPDNFVFYYNTEPTADELLLYPGTYMVTTGQTQNNTTLSVDSKSYLSYGSANMGLGINFTGYNTTEFTLNYGTNSANLGIGPLVYGYSNSDTVAGTYVFGDYTGTFTGTFDTSVDAYGIMTHLFPETAEVMRLKTVENLQINYPGFGNVGTFVQTTYRYYRELDLWPYVKSTNRVIVIPALNIDSNVTQIEKANAAFLSLPSVSIDKSISVFPNPATNTINVTLNNSQKLISLTVTDQLGKTILTKKESTTLDVSGLQKGVYFMTIVTDAGSSVKKFVKN